MAASDPEMYSAVKVEKIAKNIMERGNVLKFLVQQAQRNHIGDTDVIKHLIASIASTNSLTSKGIQPELNGEKGYGKTDAVKAVFHLVPPDWGLAASISAKALYYYENLKTGSIIFSDDVEWSDDLIATVKRSMGNFQEPQVHFTLDTQRRPLPKTMPARLVWWLSSVESVANDQLKDRQYSLDIDEDKDHIDKVSDRLREIRGEKVVRFAVDWRIAVARHIIQDIKEHESFKVVIDCAKAAKWHLKGDHRTQNKFWDLVEAFAILRFKQRIIDPDGWLHTLREDFEEARTIFMRRKSSHTTHLTNAQARTVGAVITLGEDATQAQIAEHLGISFVAVSKSLAAIEANTKYIVHETVSGKNFYRSTISALEIFSGPLVTLPDDYKDDLTTIKPPFNRVLTTILTNEYNNNNNNTTKNDEKVKSTYDELPVKEGTSSIVCTSSSLPGKGLKVLKGIQATHNEVKKGLKDGLKGSADIDIGPNPRKFVLPRIIRFLKQHPRFVDEDLRKPGEITNYGPYEVEDVATLPESAATLLIMKGVAVEAST
jgi:hypothetical protein